MKPFRDSLAIVTATIDPIRAQACWDSWLGRSRYHYPVYVVWSALPQRLTTKKAADDHASWIKAASREPFRSFTPGCYTICREGGGVVPAFAQGVEAAFRDGAEGVLCLHDDLLIEEDDWDGRFWDFPGRLDFAGFGGSDDLGSDDLYRTPYNPMQLARGRFSSNMRDAELHGRRTEACERAVVFDGFSQYGTRSWFRDAWKWLADSGIQHHFYDGILGCLAARAKIPGVLLPVKCHHLGGQTAVGSSAYQDWAKTKDPQGDQGFWEAAHRIGYQEFRDVLPLRLR